MIFKLNLQSAKRKVYSPMKISLRAFLYFLVVFISGRCLFLFHHYLMLKEESSNELFKAFTHAVRLDLSACAFLYLIPFFIIIIGFFGARNYMYQPFRWTLFLFAIIISLLQTGDIILYEDWQNKLSYKAVAYLLHPTETFSYVSWHHISAALILFFVQFCFLYFFFRRWFHADNQIDNKSGIRRILFVLIGSGLLILAYRGGIQNTPINTSFSYFSKNQVLNDASTNTIWYLAQSIYENRKTIKEKPFQFYTSYEAKKTVEDMYIYPKDSSIYFLTTPRPNIVVVVLESYCADLMKSFNGKDSCTPNLDLLVKDGVSFQSCYAPGWRSDMGLSSILSAVSCEPDKAISTQPSKYHGLASLPKTMKDQGYFTSFLYGGPAEYGNLKSFYYWHQFDQIRDQRNIVNKYPTGKLGVHDEGLFKEAIIDLAKNKKPFFSFVYTLSSHPPFDIPMKKVFTHGAVENQYINAVYYTDKCIGDFMKACKQQTWYDSTLFIFVADHGHATPTYKQWNYESHRIPLLFYGNVIQPKFRGYANSKIISETDLSATLLAQLHIPYDSFLFSKDAMNPNCPQFAPYVIHNGYGLITDRGIYSYNFHYKKVEYEYTAKPEDRSTLIQQCNSYMQRTFDFFDGL